MPEPLYSPLWYRVADLKPRLRSHVRFHRHFYRGELWYILHDHSTGKIHRFTPAAWRLIGLMDGSRTVQQIWDAARGRKGEEPPTQDELIRLLRSLHVADVLQSDIVPDTAEIASRHELQRKGRLKQNFSSPFAIRIPLLDPDRFLERFSIIGKLFFNRAFFIIWCLVVFTALFQAAVHWPELTKNITDRILAPDNLLMLWLTYPVIKTFHEFGHAFAVKRWGGEVHEMGIMFLVFTPIPYVDASGASAFREKWKRVVVGAAGMMVEVFIGAMALLLWTDMEPGTARAVMYNVIIIAGVSTLFFNGNPLLRYDGYYILSDLLEIPNLSSRGSRYMGYLFQRYLLGVEEAEPPLSTRGERGWFVCYTILAFVYRLFVFTAIILFVADKFFVVGILLACWGAMGLLVMPAFKGIRYILDNPVVRRKRNRAAVVIAAACASVAVLLFVLPFPLLTVVQGVIWIPERAMVRAGTDIFVKELAVPPGAKVKPGDLLVRGYDPLLPAQVRVTKSRIRELEIKYSVYRLTDEVQAEIVKEELGIERNNLQRALERMKEMEVRSSTVGRFIVPHPQDLPGRFLKQGELVGYVLEPVSVRVRLVISQDDVDLVRHRTNEIKVRFLDDINLIVPARIIREVPAATDTLPSSALGHEGGGDVAIDPRDSRGQKAFRRYFDFELELHEAVAVSGYGGKVLVRFDHGHEPLFYRLYRRVRNMFLKRFSV